MLSSSQLRLRTYQQQGIQFLKNRERAALFDQMGTGKTVQALLASDAEGGRTLSRLIVCPNSAIPVWQDQLAMWLGQYSVLYAGTPAARATTRSLMKMATINVICPYSMLQELVAHKRQWDAIIFDEAHRMRNRKTKVFQAARKLRSELLYVLTGTPVVNGVADLWPLLHLISPKDFGSYWQFYQQYVETETDQWGYDHAIGVKNEAKLKNVLEKYGLRRTKAEVLKELPLKQRQIIRVPMKRDQEILYEQYAELFSSEWALEWTRRPVNALAATTRCRQIVVSPLLIDFEATSAALDYLQDVVEDDLLNGPVVIFTPFEQAQKLIATRLPDNCQRYFLSGDMTLTQRAKAIKDFNEPSKQPRAMICSLHLASSFDLTAAAQAYFLGLWYNSAIHEQAEDRLHRYGQGKPVTVRYIVTANTIDETIMAIVDNKTTWASAVLDPRRLVYGYFDSESSDNVG